MGPCAAELPGNRLHLQHGPIDLIIGAEGDRSKAFHAAKARFETILSELVQDLGVLKGFDLDGPAQHAISQEMIANIRPYKGIFVTPMAAVAGTVADTILRAMTREAELDRAYVNNGGDIALHLSAGATFKTRISDAAGRTLGDIHITSDLPIRGIATSGRHGRSLSLGIADSVTVLARNAGKADVAATLIANAVDLPDHPAVTRTPACDLDDMTDLGDRCVVTAVGPLSMRDADIALTAGEARAKRYTQRNLIHGASLHLKGQTRVLNMPTTERILTYA